MKRSQLRNYIKHIITEEAKKRKLKIDNGSYDPANVADSGATNLIPHKRDEKSKYGIAKEIRGVVSKISDDITVVWDDHDDIMINYRDLFNVRVTPRWENNYDVTAFIRNEDRIKVFGLTLDQLKEFLKGNFSDVMSTKVNDAMKKVEANRGEEPQKNEPKGSKKNKVKEHPKIVADKMGEDDEPSNPMKEVGEFKKQSEHKVQKPVRLRKKRLDKKHVVKPK